VTACAARILRRRGIEGVVFDDAYAERVDAVIDGATVPVIGRAALLANKRAVGRPKDLADVEAIVRAHPEDR